MKQAIRRAVKAVLAGITAGVAVGPLAAFGLRSLFLIQGIAFRWVMIGCAVVAAVSMGIAVWVMEVRQTSQDAKL
ncbi:MAG: hypothetical protein ABEK03_08260 [Candidatus Bipolaricaulia bacterium]